MRLFPCVMLGMLALPTIGIWLLSPKNLRRSAKIPHSPVPERPAMTPSLLSAELTAQSPVGSNKGIAHPAQHIHSTL